MTTKHGVTIRRVLRRKEFSTVEFYVDHLVKRLAELESRIQQLEKRK